MLNEYKQLHHIDVVGAQDATSISCQENKKALRAVNLIKENRCSKIKVKTCADGSCQRIYIPGEEATPPIITQEVLIYIVLVDAHAGRAVMNFDVPGAYFQASLLDDKVLHMKLKGEFVDIMCKVNPEYEIVLIYEKFKKVIYVLISKAIYGMIKSALLWYELISTTLFYSGFKLNPHEQWIANKVID